MFLPRIKLNGGGRREKGEKENPLFVSRGALFPAIESLALPLQWDSVTAPEVRRERVPRHANDRGNKARGAILVISYLNAGRTEETSQCRTALWSLLPACLPCGAIAGPETSNNSLSIAPHGGGESGVLMISFRRYGPCFCPAPLCRLPST